jgi:poly-gamma-glutamate synthesis protein (capsule biosynthesis protein)
MGYTRRGLLAGGLLAVGGCLGAPESGPGEFEAGTADARLGFVGDVMLGRSVTDRWRGDDPAGLWGSMLSRLRGLDGLVLNLECCISRRGERWPDKTYYFRADPEVAVPALRAAGASVASLANNHVLDFREQGLSDTRTHLAEAGVAHAGAGPDRERALAPAVSEVGGLTVATIGLTDQWPAYAAGPDSPGTAFTPLDPTVPTTRSLVAGALDRAAAHDPDLLVASLHWGPNWETRPDATREAFARWLVDRGVDVVHGHSAHVLQGIEVHRGRPIVYDAGDFVDDYVHKDGFHNKRSALFEVTVADGDLERLRAVPVEISDETVHPADGEVAAWIRNTLRHRSAPFGTTAERVGDGLAIRLGGR